MPDKRTVTEARRAANRAAAQQSTGPKTLEGKQRAAFNSFAHGAFASQEHILRQALTRSGSDPAALDAYRQELLDDWQPAGVQQKLLIDDLAWLYWLRDQTRLALVELQGRRIPRANLRRDQRRFEARHRAPAITHSEMLENGLAALAASEDKCASMARFLNDLKAYVAQADWEKRKRDGRGYEPRVIIGFLYGREAVTARGKKLSDLWRRCAGDKAAADDPRAQQIVVLIDEELAALVEEEQLFRREQEIEIEAPEDPDWPGLHPLGEMWQQTTDRLQQIDRQINAKIRLLIRLQQRAEKKARQAGPTEAPAREELPGLGEEPSASSADRRFCGPRLSFMPMEKPRTREARVRATNSREAGSGASIAQFAMCAMSENRTHGQGASMCAPPRESDNDLRLPIKIRGMNIKIGPALAFQGSEWAISVAPELPPARFVPWDGS